MRIEQATDIFEAYTPDELATLKGKGAKDMREMIVALYEILDAYNNGYIGPGHCFE